MSQSGPGRREVAYRLFAAEFDDATLSYSESDEERAPNYVVTPTGARINRLFAVGVLTEVEDVNPEMVRGRVVDPTGAFVTYAGQYQPDALAFLERADPPLFVALSGKARTYEPDDGDRIFSSVRPESVSEVDADTRDRWIVTAAERTIDRIGIVAAAIESDLSGDELQAALSNAGVDDRLAEGVPLALDHYGTTPAYLEALRGLCTAALRVVTGEQDEVGRLELDPDERADSGDAATLATLDLSGFGSMTEVDSTTEQPETADTTQESRESDSASDEVTTDGPDVEAATGTTPREPDRDEPSTIDEGGADGSTAEAGTESPVESTTEAESTTDPKDESTTATETAVDTESTTDIDAESDIETGVETEVSGVDDADETDETDQTDETNEALETNPDDFDPGEFELDEEERQEVEEQYGTEFSTAGEVDTTETEPSMDSEEPAETETEAEPSATEAEAEADSGAAAETEPEPQSEPTPASDSDPDSESETEVETGAESEAETKTETESEPVEESAAEDLDLADAVMDVMKRLDEGEGADRDTLVETLADEHGATSDEIESEIQDALMSGRCYEPSDDRLKPI